MEQEFWLERWQRDQLGWHLDDTNVLLRKHWQELGITRGSAVFVPLCGKSLDMRYLESLGHTVAGIELSEKAIKAYFEEGGEKPERSEQFYLTRYKGPKTTIYHGDFFDISAPDILGVRAVYDRGALVALPPGLREQYADHMQRVIPEHAHILLLTLEYEQSLVPGPPHSVPEEEVHALYGARCRISTLERLTTDRMPPHFTAAGITSGVEAVYHIIKDH
jgi:thiopurine S-methyltransferase